MSIYYSISEEIKLGHCDLIGSPKLQVGHSDLIKKKSVSLEIQGSTLFALSSNDVPCSCYGPININ